MSECSFSGLTSPFSIALWKLGPFLMKEVSERIVNLALREEEVEEEEMVEKEVT